MRGSTLFDLYVMVDWSAHSAPKRGRDSIWLAVTRRRGGRLILGPAVNVPTRRAALDLLRARLRAACARGLRVLAGFDFAFGYPAGLAARLGLGGRAPWRAVWRALARRIEDSASNANNRWAVASAWNRALSDGPAPFWGCDPRFAGPCLDVRRRDPGYAGLPRLRLTDTRLRGGRSRPQEVWKLWAPGSVGSQVLLGLPGVEALRSDAVLGPVTRVWPFETGFTAAPSPARGPLVVLAEMWPGVVEAEVRAALVTAPRRVRDAAQVEAMGRWAARLDAGDRLAALFAGPPDLDAAARRRCVREEGWILGASGS